MSDKKFSYHDLEIETESIPRTSIFDLPYGLQVICTRVAGWELWDMNCSPSKLLAGEYHKNYLKLFIGDTTIVNSKKRLYRKKPVVVEAIQFVDSDSGTNFNEIVDFIESQSGCLSAGDSFKIHTLEGDMKVSVGDWIIKGVNGEFYPCKPDIFEKTYESYDSPQD